MFRSTDGGSSWSGLNTGLQNTRVTALATAPAAPGVVYAGTVGGGVFAIQQATGCMGDCDDINAVTIANLLTMVNIALGDAAVFECVAGDRNHDGAITVDEILAAVSNALNACPPQPTPTITLTPTITPTPSITPPPTTTPTITPTPTRTPTPGNTATPTPSVTGTPPTQPPTPTAASASRSRHGALKR